MSLSMSLTWTLWLLAHDRQKGRRRLQWRPHLRHHHQSLHPRMSDAMMRCRILSHQSLWSHSRTMVRPAERRQLHHTRRGHRTRKIPTLLLPLMGQSKPIRPLSTIRNHTQSALTGLGLRCQILSSQSIWVANRCLQAHLPSSHKSLPIPDATTTNSRSKTRNMRRQPSNPHHHMLQLNSRNRVLRPCQ